MAGEVGGAAVPPGFRERLLRNTVYGVGGRVVGLLVPFFLTPYLIHRIGLEAYGL